MKPVLNSTSSLYALTSFNDRNILNAASEKKSSLFSGAEENNQAVSLKFIYPSYCSTFTSFKELLFVMKRATKIDGWIDKH